MRKVHPNANAAVATVVEPSETKPTLKNYCREIRESTEVLTVWRKSLLFNGKGFTVFDGKGDLVFRVDNYESENKDEIVLMDAEGKPLLTIRRKKLSLGEQWLMYEGEESRNPKYCVKKHVNFLQSKSLAHVNHYSNSSKSGANSPSSSPKSRIITGGSSSGSSTTPPSSPRAGSSSTPAFEVEGSYTQRCCTIYDHDSRGQMAEIKRKESVNGGVAFGLDVFHLIVQPGFDAAVAMAIVILLEQMFGSRGSSLLIKA